MDTLRKLCVRDEVTIVAEMVLETLAEIVGEHPSWRTGGDYVEEVEDEDGGALYLPVSLLAILLLELGWDTDVMADWNEFSPQFLFDTQRFPDAHVFNKEAKDVLELLYMVQHRDSWQQCLTKVRKAYELRHLGAK